jgi:hypothetical protein
MLYFQVLLHDLHEVIRHSHDISESQVDNTRFAKTIALYFYNISLNM